MSASKKSKFVPERPPTFHKFPSKSLTVILVLLMIPLFTTQAPDFIKESIILTQLWEIIHIIVISIAVSYGLFSRKRTQIVTENLPGNSRNDASYEDLSGISDLAIFEDGFGNLCGSEFDEAKKIGSFVPDGTDKTCENIGGKAWFSQYSKSESMVVVSDGKFTVDEKDGHKPLNLPVRSLRSRVIEKEKIESNFRGNADDVNVQKIRGVVPINLEKKFQEVAGPSPIPWRSRSGRMELGEESRNLSYDSTPLKEFEFDHLTSSSFQDSKFSREIEIPEVENVTKSRTGAKTRPLSIGSSSEINSTLPKVLPRAKSVRTIKPSRCIVDEKEQIPSQVDGNDRKMFKKLEADSLVREARGEKVEDPSLNSRNRDFDSNFICQKEDIGDTSDVELDTSSDGDYTETTLENDSEFEGSEVDRKAGEFIAKFREQIRLQKISSAKKNSGW